MNGSFSGIMVFSSSMVFDGRFGCLFINFCVFDGLFLGNDYGNVVFDVRFLR